MKVFIIEYRYYSESYEGWDYPHSYQKIISVFGTLEKARNEVDKLIKSLRTEVEKKYHCEFPESDPEDYFEDTRGIQYDAFDSVITETYTIVEQTLN